MYLTVLSQPIKSDGKMKVFDRKNKVQKIEIEKTQRNLKLVKSR